MYQAVGMQNEVASDKTNVTYLEGTPAVNGDVLEVTDIVSSYKLTLENEALILRLLILQGF